MPAPNYTTISKFLSYVLRHNPLEIGLTLDAHGWAQVEELLQKANVSGKQLDFPTLCKVVETNAKQRITFNADKTKIRASQGHSLQIDLAYQASEPPVFLYHGTATRFVDSIRQHGLKIMQRHHVHLSTDKQTALQVGQRHGKALVFRIRTRCMLNEGFQFFCSDNGVWLVTEVPYRFLEPME